MDENEALIKDYQLTIESMQMEVASLKSQLSDCPLSAKDFKETIESLSSEIEEYLAESSEKTSALIDLQAEQEWISYKFPKASAIAELQKKLKNLNQDLCKAREKRIQEESQMLEVEKLKKLNPKLYLLVKKMIQADKLNVELKDSITNSEEQRKSMRQEYSKITTALGMEEKMKKKFKEVESQVLQKQTSVESLRNKLETLRKMTSDTIDNIENSAVKDIIRKCNELRTIRGYLGEQINELQGEYNDLLEEIDTAEKNPKKIAPAVANQNLRGEVKSLETSITERSNMIKEKEREKHQLAFNLEQSQKVLAELKLKLSTLIKKPEEVKKKVETVPEKKPEVKKGLSQKALETKRTSVLEILGKGATEGMGKEVMKILKGVGESGQGLASKVLELNRCQFPQNKSIISK